MQDHGVEVMVGENVDAELLQDFDGRNDRFGECEDVDMRAIR